jgi:hypothetical protein
VILFEPRITQDFSSITNVYINHAKRVEIDLI